MNSPPLVSVVVPFLNAERFIEESIESVLAQTYESWELLLVDDGSTDQSTDIARSYAAQYPAKVKCLEHEGHRNRGVSVSRNLAIKRATGEYIAFLDADDVWLPHTLERQVAIMESQPEAAMVYGTAKWWYGWTGRPEDAQHDWVEKHGVPPNTLVNPPNLISLFLSRTAVPCICTVLVRREVVESTGGFEEDFGAQTLPQEVGEDQVFYVKVALSAPVFVADECWAKVRMHPDSRMAGMRSSGSYHSARQSFLDWAEDYLTRQGFDAPQVPGAPDIWGSLQNELRPYRHPLLRWLSTGASQIAKHAQWFSITAWLTIARTARTAGRRSSGSLTAQPNPVRVYGWSEQVGATTLSWTATGTKAVEVHVGAPDGPLLSRSGPSGSAATGKWVRNGMMFYLQDTTGWMPRTVVSTLAVIKIKVAADDGRKATGGL